MSSAKLHAAVSYSAGGMEKRTVWCCCHVMALEATGAMWRISLWVSGFARSCEKLRAEMSWTPPEID